MGELYIGIMSGTSADGVDALLADFAQQPPRVIAHHHTPFSAPLRQEILDLCHGGERDEIETMGRVSRVLGELYATTTSKLLKQSATPATSITAIGCHGQTIRHRPRAKTPYTLQIGDGATLAYRTGITTITDFRSADIAAGGEGAPLAPAFHAALFRSPTANRIVLNIGGIANLTLLSAETGREITGFDCGPGNTLLDLWIEHQQGEQYDHQGRWGRGGTAIPELLQRLLSDPYFAEKPPKSCGREEFNYPWLASALTPRYSAQDVQTTLHQLTATTIAEAVNATMPQCDEVIVCGGGNYNLYLLQQIAEQLPQCHITSCENYGFRPLEMEALAFAWLARETLHGRYGNIPSVTGATEGVILGAIYPGKSPLFTK
ncbi:MAG: anhydro-N-acetylmuramic acid kinase [Gammaproteobacteria bacterium]|nr:anhydro-N-acetylmuramic acid kinase [Gammaproteobacteria bacterium]